MAMCINNSQGENADLNAPFRQIDCSHKNQWFSRTIEEDHSMHYYCADCGKRDTEFTMSELKTHAELEIDELRQKLNKVQSSMPGDNMDGQTLATGIKKDEGKPRWELVPYDAVEGVVEILTFGAKKYDARNWEKGIAYGRVFGAIQRHLTAWWRGEDTDKESGRSHLDHAMCELMFLSAFEKRNMTQLDDRPK